jgi:hypothetical protein
MTLAPTRIWPTWTPTISNYTCSVTKTAPAMGTKITHGVDFDGRWTIKNIGHKAWNVNEVDYRYISGTEMQANESSYDLTKKVNSGSSIDIIVDMIAPATPGTYTTTWGLKIGSQVFCYMSVRIVSTK